jgi:hypothetical protein
MADEFQEAGELGGKNDAACDGDTGDDERTLMAGAGDCGTAEMEAGGVPSSLLALSGKGISSPSSVTSNSLLGSGKGANLIFLGV